MSNVRTNLIEKEDRPLRSTQVVQFRYDDSGMYTVGLKLTGYTSIPCDDRVFESRSYEFMNSKWATLVGLNLIRYGISSMIKNLLHRKK